MTLIEKVATLVIACSFVGIVWQVVYGIWDWMTFDPRMAKARKEADEWYARAVC